MNNLLEQLQLLFEALRINLPWALGILGILWAIHLVNYLLGYQLNRLGLYPRQLKGIPGILFCPFLHGSFNHLFFNSIPLFVLVNFLLLRGLPVFLQLTGFLILLSGIAVWCIGRRGIHVGASSLVMGYWSYLIVDAIKHPSVITVVLCVLSLYYFGGLLMNLLPQGERDSVEGHVSGFVAGILAAYLF